MSKSNEYDKKLAEEIEKRISEMESDDCEFPKKFGKRDYIVLAAVCAVCLILVIAGGFIR
ncbi:MAG: hypothetical protein K2J73_05515 [Oscillospiraceae bacterium]|nr:hypothetical protein [Oscillospiraceae bacterium]